ncbi:glycosyltransferase [Pedobacter xixiisoli]|nr:glycosyltransferase [Pedobacter xixiisoli]
MSDLKKVLFLPGWYPNKSDNAVGSFIMNHAEAVSAELKVDVLHVCGDEDSKKIYNFEKSSVNGIDTYVLYYRKSKSKHVFAQFLKGILYFVGQFYAYHKYRQLNSRPTFFHVHVLTRAAILPYTLKFFGSNISYFITEHWSRYLPQDNSYQGFFRKLITTSVVKKSSGITAVSENLKFHMNRHGLAHRNFKVISNVTRDLFFENMEGQGQLVNHFVHVSNFAANCKNVKGILQSFKLLRDEGYLFSLTMVGDGDDFELAKASAYGLENVDFTGFLYNNDVVSEMRKATALILFSNYENQPVVITESLSLGVPVVATAVGGIPEMIDESNGILVQPNDVDALSKAIKQIIIGEKKFDRNKIKEEAARKFKSEVVAQQLIAFYRDGGVDI